MNRDRSPMHGRRDIDDDAVRVKEEVGVFGDRDRSRRGDKPSRFGPRSSSPNLGGRKGGAEKRIFVSNIAYEYRWQELKDLFREEIGEVSYVELFTDDNSKPRGCGIVEFESAESVQKAVDKMHRYDLNGRKLVVKEDFGVERDKCGRPMKGGERGGDSNMGGGGSGGGNGGGRDMQDMRDLSRRREESRPKWESNAPSLNPSQINNSGQSQSGAGNNQWGNTYGLSPQFLEGLWISGPLVPKVFVANLDYKVDRKKLKEVFKMAGKVVRAELHLDKDGKSRGFGVIEYDHPVEAVQAISMFHNQMLFDRKLTVRMDRVENKSDAPVKLPEGLRGIGMGLGTNGNPLQDVSRNLPSLAQNAGLVGAVPAAASNLAAANFNALSNAAALSNVVNSSSMGLGNTGPIGLGNLGNGMLPSGLGGPGDLSSLSSLAAASGFGTGNLGGGLNVTSQLGGLANAAGLGGNAFGGGMVTGTNFLGSNAFSGAGNNAFSGAGDSTSNLTGNAFGTVNRSNFDSMNNGVLGSGYITGTGDRDFRTMPSPAVAAFQNNQSRLGGASALQSNNNNSSNNGNNAVSRGRDIVLVKNLPSTFTWQMLRDKFRDIGEVKYAEMRAKDAGLVRFNNEWDAERAVHMMDRKRIDGRAIEVSLFG